MPQRTAPQLMASLTDATAGRALLLVLAHPRQRLKHPIECLAHVSGCDRSRLRRTCVLDRQWE